MTLESTHSTTRHGTTQHGEEEEKEDHNRLSDCPHGTIAAGPLLPLDTAICQWALASYALLIGLC